MHNYLTDIDLSNYLLAKTLVALWSWWVTALKLDTFSILNTSTEDTIFKVSSINIIIYMLKTFFD